VDPGVFRDPLVTLETPDYLDLLDRLDRRVRLVSGDNQEDLEELDNLDQVEIKVNVVMLDHLDPGDCQVMSVDFSLQIKYGAFADRRC